MAKVAPQLNKDSDYEVDEKNKNVILIQIPNSKHEIYGSTFNTIKWYFKIYT